MGNRSKYVAAGAATAALVVARRRARRRAAAEGIGAAIMPSRTVDAPAQWEMPPDEGHARGHRHLSRHERRRRDRREPWSRHGDGAQHPYAPD
jgi:hypothetical protein